MKKEIQNFEELESFLKKHNYTYPKNWKTKLKKIKRKDRNSSTWKDHRMAVYALIRTTHCIRAITKNMLFVGEQIIEKINKTGSDQFLKLLLKNSLTRLDTKKIWQEILLADNTKYFHKVIKKGGKNYYKRNITPETLKFEKLLGVKIPELIKLPKKKEIILRIMQDDAYWNFRHTYLGKSVEDKNNINIARKEAQEYFKSVCTYIKQPKYDKIFFINYTDAKTAEIMKKYWKLYLKIC
jgi:hypothetical protein